MSSVNVEIKLGTWQLLQTEPRLAWNGHLSQERLPSAAGTLTSWEIWWRLSFSAQSLLYAAEIITIRSVCIWFHVWDVKPAAAAAAFGNTLLHKTAVFDAKFLPHFTVFTETWLKIVYFLGCLFKGVCTSLSHRKIFFLRNPAWPQNQGRPRKLTEIQHIYRKS